MSPIDDRNWWRWGIFYQVYPRSFADADGDGVGDLRGLTSRLPYVASLGVDAIWLSPFYRSPMTDFGYDISDHCDVDPIFGSISDFDEMLQTAHGLGLRIVVDWVPNHTSDQHPWFSDSRRSRASARRGWYVWRDGTADGGPPNNWQSQFPRVGSAWTFDAASAQWYLHSYLPTQPDLDWTNPEVVTAMSDVLRFWLRRGVDGFRIDVPHRLGKDQALRDNPMIANEPDPRYVGARFDEDQRSVHGHLQVIRSVVDEFPDRVLVGEVYVVNQRRMVEYVNGGQQLHLAHNFSFLRLPWDVRKFREAISEIEEILDTDAWASWSLGNHDHGRIASRFDHDGLGVERARLIMMLLLTLRGTPFIYQGDELGLPDSLVPAGLQVDIHDRDRARGPMPWNPPSRDAPAAGFSSGRPWLPLAETAGVLNVETQSANPGSMLALLRDLAMIRRASDALTTGRMVVLEDSDPVLAYTRTGDDGTWVVAMNFEAGAAVLDLASVDRPLEVVRSTDPVRVTGPMTAPVLSLGPLEGVLLRKASGGPP
jgi:alpha-glucosidase